MSSTDNIENIETIGKTDVKNPFIVAKDVNVYYGDNHAIKDVSLQIAKNQVIALIGPSGCGKSTFIRCINRMNDTIDIAKITGKISLDGEDIYSKKLDPVILRARVGMVFQNPILSQKVFMTMLHMDQESMVLQKIEMN